MDPSPFTIDSDTRTVTGTSGDTGIIGKTYTITLLGELPNQQCAQMEFNVIVVDSACKRDLVTAGTDLVNTEYVIGSGVSAALVPTVTQS